MNHSKLILVGCISAFVAITTSLLGVAGTIIGSVISSVLYNMLSEVLEKPVANVALKRDFEWELAYVFPLVVIAIIQLLLILALLSQWGFLPGTFLNLYLSLQDIASNNLYRVLGLSLIIMSVYPFVLKPDIIKQTHGLLIGFIGLVFLARGFVDLGNRITNLYDVIFQYFDFPIALIAFILLVFVIYKILISANESKKEFDRDRQSVENRVRRRADVHHSRQSHKVIRPNGENRPIRRENRQNHYDSDIKDDFQKEHHFERALDDDSKQPKRRINKSSGNIHFESNDLLDDFKK